MDSYKSLCDDFYVTLTLSTEMELPNNRETVLHYFERVRKQYPSMQKFYNRSQGHYVLEEEKDGGQYRWTTLEPRRIYSGVVNPVSAELALQQHQTILDLAPPFLSLSPIDCDSIELVFGFDYNYRGNHNELLMEALGVHPMHEKFAQLPGRKILNNEPALTMCLDEDCRWQFRCSVETRTSEYQVRSGEYPEEQISVYLTARYSGSLENESGFSETLNRLAEINSQMVQDYAIENVLEPLKSTISIR